MFEVRVPVDSLHLATGRGGRLLDVREEAVCFQVGDDRSQSVRPLHMEGRGVVGATLVNEKYVRDGLTVAAPVGIRLESAADVPVVVSEEAVLMSPHPLESPTPDPLRTTQDAVLTVQTIPAHGSLNYSYGDL